MIINLKRGKINMQPEQFIQLRNTLVRQSCISSGCTNGGIYFLRLK